jgi:hypothetical protein
MLISTIRISMLSLRRKKLWFTFPISKPFQIETPSIYHTKSLVPTLNHTMSSSTYTLYGGTWHS